MRSTKKHIQHLYWRAGFGLGLKDAAALEGRNMQGIIDDLFHAAQKPIPIDVNLNRGFETRKRGLSEGKKRMLKKTFRQKNVVINTTWLKQMQTNKQPLLERMSLFWHGHFACVSRNNPYLSEDYCNTIRQYALGNFKNLVLAVARNPAMIHFLNNKQNKKDKPNENFARELMELFTIGIGHYTEQDIKEAARAFTGWSYDRKFKYFFRKRQHDYGMKTFMGETGRFDGEDIIDIILKNKQTARHIATKAYRYFVNDKPNEAHIETLATTFYKSNYNIESLMRGIFESDWFYRPEHIGTKIKSPIDVLVGVMRDLNVQFKEDKAPLLIQKILGQTLLNPPNVAGWAGGKAWIDNATLMFRLNLVNYLFQTADLEISEKPEFEAMKRKGPVKRIQAELNIEPIVQAMDGQEEDYIFKTLTDWLIQPELKFSKEKINAFTSKGNRRDYAQSLLMRLMTLPEYQMC